MKSPRFDEMYALVLKALREADGEAFTRQIDDFVASYLSLTPRDIYSDLDRHGRPRFHYNLGWTRNYLKDAGYIQNPQRGKWTLTAKGKRTGSISKEEVARERGHAVAHGPPPGMIAFANERALQSIEIMPDVARVVFKIETASGFSSLPPLTPTYLESEVLPYFRALDELEGAICEMIGKGKKPITILSLRRRSPVEVSFDGAGDAIERVREDIIPWRRKHAQQMAWLAEKEKLEEIRQKEAEILEIQAKAAETEAHREEIAAKAVKAREEAEGLRIQNERERVKLAQETFDLAVHVVKTIALNASPEEISRQVVTIMPALKTFIKSDLTPTLPEGDSKNERPRRRFRLDD
jgi:hypothetical protein